MLPFVRSLLAVARILLNTSTLSLPKIHYICCRRYVVATQINIIRSVAYQSEQRPMINLVPSCALALILAYAIAVEADGIASDLDGNWTVNSLPWPSDGEAQLAHCAPLIHTAVRP